MFLFFPAPVVIKQQARIERLRIELNTEKAKLIVMKQEVSELESNQNVAIVRRTDEELEKQLEREILHLRCQCEQLTRECDKLPDNEGKISVFFPISFTSFNNFLS